MASNVLTALRRQVHKIPPCKQLHTHGLFFYKMQQQSEVMKIIKTDL